MKNKNSFWQRFRLRYRISALNENTLSEVWHFRLSGLGMLLTAIILMILTFGILAAIIWLTPIKQYLPGYDENIRQQLVEEMERVDSLNNCLLVQNQYLDIVHDVMSGELETDSVALLDSITVIERAELLKQKAEVTEQYVAQYEEKERDNLTLFLTHNSTPALVFSAPIHGVIEQRFNPAEKRYGVSINAGHNNLVKASLAGRVVAVEYTIESAWTVLMQHENNYISIYRGLSKVDKEAMTEVKTSESIGVVADSTNLVFELWQSGKPLNPEEYIVF